MGMGRGGGFECGGERSSETPRAPSVSATETYILILDFAVYHSSIILPQTNFQDSR